MIALSSNVLADIMAHAQQEYPRESCGLVVVSHGRQMYKPGKNLAQDNQHFVLDPACYAAAEETGEVVLVVHSHPNLPPTPSQADRVGCERSGLPWLIVNPATGAYFQFAPEGYQPGLYGREFSHGVLDCYAFVRDYYERELGIVLPDPDRDANWWLKGQSLYLEHYAAAGFARVDGQPQQHDVLLMQLASPVPNHAAVYLGHGYMGHHQMGRLSSRDVYAGWYQKITVGVYRHKDAPPC